MNCKFCNKKIKKPLIKKYLKTKGGTHTIYKLKKSHLICFIGNKLKEYFKGAFYERY